LDGRPFFVRIFLYKRERMRETDQKDFGERPENNLFVKIAVDEMEKSGYDDTIKKYFPM
jgi:hypothetical protein